MTRNDLLAAAIAPYSTPKLGGFGTVMKVWPTKLAGPQVTAEHLLAAYALIGMRSIKPTFKHLALAMYLRADGGTEFEHMAVFTAAMGQADNKHNVRRDAERAGYISTSQPGNKRYVSVITDTGRAAIELWVSNQLAKAELQATADAAAAAKLAVAAAAAKAAKRASKPKAARKPKPVETVVELAPNVPAPVEPVADEPATDQPQG